MAQDHRLQPQRFELKYLIDEAITPAVRDFVSSYLDLDEYGLGWPNLAYPVHSLYLDSDDLITCQHTFNGVKNRFKLRLRYYDERPDAPVFFEIKSRVDNCILKQRCGVRREAVPLVLAGQLPEPQLLLSREPRHLVTIQRFHALQQMLKARPKLHNGYLREAWVSGHDNSVRVTIDRHVRAEAHFEPTVSTELRLPTPVFNTVILEIKFTNRFPSWLRELVQRFDLMRSSAAKYVQGIVAVGEGRFHDGDRTLDWEGQTPRNLPGRERVQQLA